MLPCAWCGSLDSGAISDHQVCHSCGHKTYANGIQVPDRPRDPEPVAKTSLKTKRRK